jgi:polyphosphate kinase 2 (PPK2 family)
MFEIAELGHKVSKTDYLEKVPKLRTQLLMRQQQLRNQEFSVIILISGVDGGGSPVQPLTDLFLPSTHLA